MTLETAAKKADKLTLNQLRHYLKECNTILESKAYVAADAPRRMVRPILQCKKEFERVLLVKWGKIGL